MAVRKLKPVTPGQRHKVIGTFEDITASVPEKSLVYGKRSTGGRNNTGKMTTFWRPAFAPNTTTSRTFTTASSRGSPSRSTLSAEG